MTEYLFIIDEYYANNTLKNRQEYATAGEAVVAYNKVKGIKQFIAKHKITKKEICLVSNKGE